MPRISGWDSKNNPKFVNTTMTPDSNGAIHWIWPYAGDPVRVTASYYDRAGNTSSCKNGLVTVGIAPSNK